MTSPGSQKGEGEGKRAARPLRAKKEGLGTRLVVVLYQYDRISGAGRKFLLGGGRT